MMPSGAIVPAGWAMRRFPLEAMLRLYAQCSPRLVEISKDFLRDAVSIKELGRSLEQVGRRHGSTFAYAGTTDLVGCSGLSWSRYREYLRIQIAQARFLQCAVFRFFLGAATGACGRQEAIARIRAFAEDCAPAVAAVEIDGGLECELPVLGDIVAQTSVQVVVDLENMRSAGLSSATVLDAVPLDRIAYFHQRNLPGVWVEHEPTLEDELLWHRACPDGIFLWEPKRVEEPALIEELFLEYRKTDREH
jgi:hypothetical protein